MKPSLRKFCDLIHEATREKPETKLSESASKTLATKSVEAITAGSTDTAGNKVVSVLAKHNEYCIYEIEQEDINYRIRVLIDGHTDQSEKIIQLRFNGVKQKFIEAKGILAKSSNYGMMKQRIAHTLSTCLNSADVDGNNEFSRLIDSITREHESLVINRAIYLAPSLTSCTISFAAFVTWLYHLGASGVGWSTVTCLLSASLGGSLSILINAKKLNFEEFRTRTHYFLLGSERMTLAFIAGAITYIAMRSGLISPEISESSHWTQMAILVASGFSEKFVPGVLENISTKDQ